MLEQCNIFLCTTKRVRQIFVSFWLLLSMSSLLLCYAKALLYRYVKHRCVPQVGFGENLFSHRVAKMWTRWKTRSLVMA
jgi:hypothetical protein